ncbi:endolytic transglycosylase MltG [Orrella marina]|uniref:Endolytic murein transglycosylase n=1 Tax=Orrella marina TaxID=2163011 RepID=A0A2R4XHD0_9BURK|nr:endolytic transglycosylase MltG [Orrella marina]AWB33238.1 endolytic transglycosylase MltG [Orrella marina]
MRWLFKMLFWILLLAVLAAGGVAAFSWHWVNKPLDLPKPEVDIRVYSGSGPGVIADEMIRQGINMPRESFILLARLTEKDRLIKAGGYQIQTGDSLWQVLDKMARGEVTQRQVALIEGWTVPQIAQALANHPDIETTIDPVTLHDQKALAKRLGLDTEHVEGLLFPDTYVFPVGSTDEEILRQALKAQQDALQKAWENRAPDLPLKSPYEALILASIVEKETGFHGERARIAGVFINRLNVGMPLQTDPTVIYGMGDRYEGRIRRADLQRDTPWNTYTRPGLPPTPIAAVSRASLEAALHPESHDFYYFVARGDGTSEFAKDLRQHNRNVAKYILGK